MTNQQVNDLWTLRQDTASGVKWWEDGNGKDSDFITVAVDGTQGKRTFERKPNTTEWVEVK